MAGMKLKLLIDKKGQKVVFAEAAKDFVDLLYTLLRVPLGDAARLLPSDSMVGSLPKLFQSIHSLGEAYLQPNVTKQSILWPHKSPVPVSAAVRRLLPDGLLPPPPPNHAYMCHSCCSPYRVTLDNGRKCPECSSGMTQSVEILAEEKAEGEGHVKDMVTYMVMDDLTVKPETLISTISILNAANVREFELLESKDVEVGMEETLKLLEASLCSEAALTYLFLGRKGSGEGESEVEISLINEMEKTGAV